MKSEKTMIFEYVKNRKGHNVGVVLAKCCEDGYVRIGFSLCNINSGDKFDKAMGIQMAEGRAEKSNSLIIPYSLDKNILRIIDRADKHFKDKPFAIRSDITLAPVNDLRDFTA